MTTSTAPIPKNLLQELSSLVKDQHPNPESATVEELLQLLLPQLPEELSANKSALTAITQALSTIPEK